jgi:C4-dicarboxylate-specific signal transduction histidine kinase
VHDDAGNFVEFVGTDMDITEHRRAEAEILESDRRYRESEMQLAHANRVATMDQLSASIAHEVNQPIAATVTNAQKATARHRWNREFSRRASSGIRARSDRAARPT